MSAVLRTLFVQNIASVFYERCKTFLWERYFPTPTLSTTHSLAYIHSTRSQSHTMNPSTNDPSFTLATPIPACPILLEAKTALDKAHDLRKALRHLSRSTRRCLTCPENNSCPSIRYIDHSVDRAIQQLTRDWNLDQD